MNSSKSGITPFTGASLEVMQERFSAPEIARRKQSTLANFLRRHHIHHPDEAAAKLIELARAALPPQAARVPAMQKALAATVDLHECLERNAKRLRIAAALELADTPYALATSISGLGFVLAAAGRRYLLLLRCIVRNEVPYLMPERRRPGADPQAQAQARREAWKVMVAKWRKIPGWRKAAFADDKPIGFWRRVVMVLYDIDLPFGE